MRISSFRTAWVLAAFVILAGAASSSGSSFPAPGGASSPTPRIVSGKGTSIADAPWQVALIEPKGRGRGSKPSDRYFCTGSLLASDVVVTAAHCMTRFTKSGRKRVSVIAGRTWLNKLGTGESANIDKALFALRPNGKRRYRPSSGSESWDVALLQLARPLSAPTIRLAGKSEAGAWTPGRKVRTTGWGVTSWNRSSTSNRLRIAGQVILPNSVCRRDNGSAYDPKTMVCLGGTAGNSSTCAGDSGGPLFSRTSDGHRLVGLTSFGDFFCRGNVPSVDTRVSGTAIRTWIRQTTISISGVDPVGEGARSGPVPDYCRVPALTKRTRSSASKALRRSGCSLGRIRKVQWPGVGRKRVVASWLPEGWLAPVGFGIKIAINK